MEWALYIAVGIGIVVFVGTRIAWRRKTYSEVLTPYLAQYGYDIVRIEIPRFWQTGPFPKLSVRMGAVQTQVAGVDTTHFAFRIVTFKNSEGEETTRWVRLLLNSLGCQDIIWEPGTTEVPDKKGWPT